MRKTDDNYGEIEMERRENVGASFVLKAMIIATRPSKEQSSDGDEGKQEPSPSC